MNHLPKILTLLENIGIGATYLFIPLIANTFSRSYIQVGAVVAGYSLAQTLSYTYFGKLSDRLGDMRLLSMCEFNKNRFNTVQCHNIVLHDTRTA